MNLTRYALLKQKKLVTVKRVNQAYAAEIITFDRETGEQNPPIVEALDADEIARAKQTLLDSINSCDMLIEDLKTLAEPKPMII